MTTSIAVRRPGLRSLMILTVCEAKMVARDTAGVVVTLGLPLLILLTSAGAAAGQEITKGMTALDLVVLPMALVMVIATVGVVNMPSFLGYYRRSGILRRLAVTPASPVMVLVAQAVVSFLQAAVGIALAVVVATIVFGANPPRDLGATVGIVALSMAAMYSIGMIVAAVAPTPNSAVAIGLVAFFTLGALGGMFGSSDALPEPVARLGDWLPFGAAADALSAAWAGNAVGAGQLVSLGATVVVSIVVAGLLFRWE